MTKRALARAMALGGDARLLLGRKRGADQQPQDLLGDVRRNADPRRVGARAEDHLALAAKIAGRVAGGALGARHLLGQALALGDELDELAVDLGQALAQLL